MSSCVFRKCKNYKYIMELKTQLWMFTLSGVVKFGSVVASTLVQWRTAFWVCLAVLVSTNIIYCIWTEGEQQWWDDVRHFGYPLGWKHGPIIKDDLTLTSTHPEYMELTKKLCAEIH